ncbi:hypothetical protein D3C75_678900 [compost metagenome]
MIMEFYEDFMLRMKEELAAKKLIELFDTPQEREILNAIIVTSELLEYRIEKNETSKYKDIRISKNTKPVEAIVITVSKMTGKVIAGYQERIINARGSFATVSTKYVDSYNQSIVEVLKEVITWL